MPKHVYASIGHRLPTHSASDVGNHVRVRVGGPKVESVEEAFGKNGAWRAKGGKFASTSTKGGGTWTLHTPPKLKERVKALGGKLKPSGTGGAFAAVFETHEKALSARTALVAEGWRVSQHDVPGALWIQGAIDESVPMSTKVSGSDRAIGDLYDDPASVVHVHVADGQEHKVTDAPDSTWQRFKQAAIQHGAASIHADKDKRTYSAHFWPKPGQPHSDLIAAHNLARHARIHFGDFASKARLSQVHGDLNEGSVFSEDVSEAVAGKVEEKKLRQFTGVPKLSDVVHVAKKLGAEVTNRGGDVLLYHPSWGAKLRIHSQRGDATKEILHHVNGLIASANEAFTSRIDAALVGTVEAKTVENFSEVFDDADRAEEAAEQRSMESAESAPVYVIGLGDDNFTVLPEAAANDRLRTDDATTVVAIFIDGDEILSDFGEVDDAVQERHSISSKVGNRLARKGLVTGQLARNKNKRQSARARTRRGAIYAAKKAARKSLHHPDSH